MKRLFTHIHSFYQKAAVQFFLRTTYYLLILLALLWLYGFKDTNTSTFIYNDF
ncbi:MAG: teichoic acid D-Ala incorporation-associated protein DltX [Bacillaceae bacterium]